MRRTVVVSIISLLGATALAACSGSGGGYGSEPTSAPPSSSEGTTSPSPTAATSGDAGAPAGADVATADTSLGTIVVDGQGMTAYYFDMDVKDSGTSACAGDCAVAWPAITTESATPSVSGVTAEVGTIPTADGAMQITIDGRPIYTFAQDAAPGDVNGQGVNDVWFVIAPDGAEIGG